MTLDRESLVGKRVTVVGLGIEGVDLVRYLASHGALVTVSDAKNPEALAARIRELDSLPVRFSLGENRAGGARPPAGPWGGGVWGAAGRRHVVGGNIGVGLLGLLDEITPETWVVVEVSHTQLELLERSRHVACVLN